MKVPFPLGFRAEYPIKSPAHQPYSAESPHTGGRESMGVWAEGGRASPGLSICSAAGTLSCTQHETDDVARRAGRSTSGERAAAYTRSHLPVSLAVYWELPDGLPPCGGGGDKTSCPGRRRLGPGGAPRRCRERRSEQAALCDEARGHFMAFADGPWVGRL